MNTVANTIQMTRKMTAVMEAMMITVWEFLLTAVLLGVRPPWSWGVGNIQQL